MHSRSELNFYCAQYFTALWNVDTSISCTHRRRAIRIACKQNLTTSVGWTLVCFSGKIVSHLLDTRSGCTIALLILEMSPVSLFHLCTCCTDRKNSGSVASYNGSNTHCHAYTGNTPKLPKTRTPPYTAVIQQETLWCPPYSAHKGYIYVRLAVWLQNGVLLYVTRHIPLPIFRFTSLLTFSGEMTRAQRSNHCWGSMM